MVDGLTLHVTTAEERPVGNIDKDTPNNEPEIEVGRESKTRKMRK